MATHSHERHSYVADENTPPTTLDPFWQARPRMVSREIEVLLKAAAEQVVPLPPPQALQQRRNRQAASAPTARRVMCTHVTMGRLYGNCTCDNCGRPPSNGYLYQCQQDDAFQDMTPRPDSEPTLTVPDDDNYFEAQAKVAESLGMSRSIIKQIRSETFTMDQVETLFAQRRNVIRTIKDAERSSAHSTPQLTTRFPSGPPTPADAVTALPVVSVVDVAHTPSTSSAGTPGNTPLESQATTPKKNKASHNSQTTPRCALKICHTCRPFLRDRALMSIGSVQHNELPAVTEDEITNRLPISDPKVVRNIGLREPPNLAPAVQSPDHVMTHQGDGYMDDLAEDWTPTTASYSEGLTDSSDSVDLFPCPGAGVCPLWSPSQGCAYDNGYDDGKRAMTHGIAADSYNMSYLHGILPTTPGGTPSSCSTVSLPNPRTPPLTPITPTTASFGLALPNANGKVGKAATVCGVPSGDVKTTYRYAPFGLRSKPSCSSLGSEVEVDGGVALKEETIETGTPDIITDEQ